MEEKTPKKEIHISKTKDKNTVKRAKDSCVLVILSMQSKLQSEDNFSALLDYCAKKDCISNVAIVMSGYLNRYNLCVNLVPDEQKIDSEVEAVEEWQKLNIDWQEKNIGYIEEFKRETAKDIIFGTWKDIIRDNQDLFNQYRTLILSKYRNGACEDERFIELVDSMVREKTIKHLENSQQGRGSQTQIEQAMREYLVEELAVTMMFGNKNEITIGETPCNLLTL